METLLIPVRDVVEWSAECLGWVGVNNSSFLNLHQSLDEDAFKKGKALAA